MHPSRDINIYNLPGENYISSLAFIFPPCYGGMNKQNIPFYTLLYPAYFASPSIQLYIAMNMAYWQTEDRNKQEDTVDW